MAIDRIGRGGPPAPPSPDASPDAHPSALNKPAAEPFSLSPAIAKPSVEAVAVPAPAALDRLRSGRVDLAGYIDQKVDEAMAHLAGLPAGQLETIRSALRDRLATDPALVDLVRAVAGAVAPGHLPEDG